MSEVATGQQGRQDEGQQGFSSYCNPLLYMVLFSARQDEPDVRRFCEGVAFVNLAGGIGRSPGDLRGKHLRLVPILGYEQVRSVLRTDAITSDPFMSALFQSDAITSNLLSVTQDVFNEDGKFMRKIRSFVRREGRLTKAGREKVLEELWPVMGIDFAPEPLDMVALFGREAPVVLEIGFGMGASPGGDGQERPEKNFIGIEVHSPGVGACLGTAQRRASPTCASSATMRWRCWST